LLCIALLGAIPRLYLGATQFIEYDGYWHVFIAAQDDWQQFRWEYNANFHPPLFYLLLKVVMRFGRTRLVYRAISLAAGIAAIFVIGQIAKKISRVSYMPAFAALAYGIALPSIIISCEGAVHAQRVLGTVSASLEAVNGCQSLARSRVVRPTRFWPVIHYGAFFYIFSWVWLWCCFIFVEALCWNRLAPDLAAFAYRRCPARVPHLCAVACRW
jgi:hypothetical protein